MSIMLAHKKTSEIIKIKIRFKLSPKIFEVVLLDTAQNTQMGIIDAPFTNERQTEILSQFWDLSHEYWHDIFQEIPSPRGARLGNS